MTKPEQRGLGNLILRMNELEERLRIVESQVKGPPVGYKCATCGTNRPANWLVYEIEREGEWVRPCCAICAREDKSRGPFPQTSHHETGVKK